MFAMILNLFLDSSLASLQLLINALNSFGQIPRVMSSNLMEAIQRTVDYHNTYFTEGSSDAKDAVVNYISSNSCCCTCSGSLFIDSKKCY